MCGPCCPGKPNVKHLNVGGQSIGISGFDEIMTRGLAHLDQTDAQQKAILLEELKKHNYVPDYFKRINDHYGHLIGSKVLVEMGQLLLKSLRSIDIVTRYGGDEFVIVLPQTTPNAGCGDR